METPNLNQTKVRKTPRCILLVALGSLTLILISVALAQNLQAQLREKRLGADGWAQWVNANHLQVLAENGPLHVFGSKKFPRDLKCEVHVGSFLYPYFDTEGEKDRLKTAGISLDPWNAISVVHKEGKNDSYLLYFFTTDAEGKIKCLFDLDMDGVWDVKESPTLRKYYIFYQKDWLEVDKIEGRNSDKPTAEKDGKHYEFKKVWSLTKT